MTVFRSFSASVGCFLVVGALSITDRSQGGEALPQPLRLAREAFLNSSSTLKSGRGKGTFQIYIEKSDGKVSVSGRITSYFKDRRYHVRLEFDDPKKYAKIIRKIIICDGSGLFSSDFWDNPSYALIGEGRVHHAVTDNKPSAAGFPWDLSRPWVSDIDLLIQKLPWQRLTVTELPEKGYRLQYKVGEHGSFSVVDVLEKYGWNASKRITYRDDQTPPTRIYEATWKNEKGQWYVDSLIYQVDSRFRGDGLEKWTLKYYAFEPNAEVPDRLFKVDALDLKPGDRILDFVPNQETHVYRYEKNRATSEEELDKILPQIRGLPQLRPKQEKSATQTVFLALAIILPVCGVLLLLYRLRHNKKAA